LSLFSFRLFHTHYFTIIFLSLRFQRHCFFTLPPLRHASFSAISLMLPLRFSFAYAITPLLAFHFRDAMPLRRHFFRFHYFHFISLAFDSAIDDSASTFHAIFADFFIFAIDAIIFIS